MSPVAAPAHAPRHVPDPSPRGRPARRADHLRVVRPAERRRARLSPATGVVLTACLFALLFAVAIAQTMLVQGQVRLDRLDRELTTEQARYQELRKDVAEMESPERVVEAAQGQGMVAPHDLVYLHPSAPDAPRPDDDPATDTTEATTRDEAEGAWSNMKPLLAAPAP